MKYYWIKEDKNYNLSPKIKHSYSLLEIQRLKNGDYGRMKDRTLFRIAENPGTIDTDIIVYPFFMVSGKIRTCISLFEPNLYFKEFILLDQKYRNAQEYFFPMIRTFTSNQKSDKAENLEIDRDEVGDCSIFAIKGVNHRFIIVRLDLIESILRRGHKGFTLEEITYIRGGNRDVGN